MLTDDDARRLLHRAGETVDVGPAPPTPDVAPRRRVWPVLAAAAAVALVAALTVVISARPTGAPEPAKPTTVTVPSVLGYDFDTALQVLHDAGFALTTETVSACNESYALGTEPAAGTPVAPGAEVVLRQATPGPGFCILDEDAMLDLLAFADGRGPAPRLAPTVTLYDGSGNQVVLTAEQAADPSRWRVCATDDSCTAVLDELSTAAHRPYPVGIDEVVGYQSPVLTDRPDPACTFEPGARGFGAPDAQIGILLLTDGAFCTQEFVISVHRDEQGLIEAVGLLKRRTG